MRHPIFILYSAKTYSKKYNFWVCWNYINHCTSCNFLIFLLVSLHQFSFRLLHLYYFSENLIDKLHNGEHIFNSLLSEFRLSTGPVCIAILKQLVEKVVNSCIEKNDGGDDLTKLEGLHTKIGEMISGLYAVESVTYLTASLIDQYENQDCEMEVAIVKAFGVKCCNNLLYGNMELVGTDSYLDDNWYSNLFRDSLANVVLPESISNLKIMISLMGMQHAGVSFMFLWYSELLIIYLYRKFSFKSYTRCASIKCGFQTSDGAPEQFV